MKNKYFKSVMYALYMIIFFTLSYIFIYEGINIKTKKYIYYQEKSSFNYDKNIKDKIIDDIRIKYNYESKFSENISGYYKYNVNLEVISKETNEKYKLLEDKVNVLNGSTNKIIIDDFIDIEYDYYKKNINNQECNLKLIIDIYSYLNFNSIEGDYPLQNSIVIEIPVEENPKIIGTNINENNKLSDFSKKEDVNYLNIFMGIICLSFAITFLIQVIKIMIYIHNKEKSYKTKLNEILAKYDNKIVNVKKLYNIKKYNLIYVDSFEELLDVYNTYNSIINYREIKKNEKSIFVVLNDKNAWIYILKEK